jgi:hypothetical protein
LYEKKIFPTDLVIVLLALVLVPADCPANASDDDDSPGGGNPFMGAWAGDSETVTITADE